MLSQLILEAVNKGRLIKWLDHNFQKKAYSGTYHSILFEVYLNLKQKSRLSLVITLSMPNNCKANSICFCKYPRLLTNNLNVRDLVLELYITDRSTPSQQFYKHKIRSRFTKTNMYGALQLKTGKSIITL